MGGGSGAGSGPRAFCACVGAVREIHKAAKIVAALLRGKNESGMPILRNCRALDDAKGKWFVDHFAAYFNQYTLCLLQCPRTPRITRSSDYNHDEQER